MRLDCLASLAMTKLAFIEVPYIYIQCIQCCADDMRYTGVTIDVGSLRSMGKPYPLDQRHACFTLSGFEADRAADAGV
jgi:hypothetical protein